MKLADTGVFLKEEDKVEKKGRGMCEHRPISEKNLERGVKLKRGEIL